MQGIPAKDYFNYQICRVQKTLSLILYHMTFVCQQRAKGVKCWKNTDR